MRIERVSGLAPADFVEQYVRPNRPVIVTGAMDGWPARERWTPDYLADQVGDIEVQVYDDLFGLKDVMPLSDYLDTRFGLPQDAASTEYVRGYSRLKAVDFFWADEAFERLRDDWATPGFLPQEGFLVPQGPAPAERALFPYRGLFISSRGCRTRLHRDPWTTSAVLCQFHGRKQLLMYAPDQAPHLVNGDGFADVEAPDLQRFPSFHEARLAHRDVLEPGEVLFIPGGWLHHVTTLSDSISVTWNFLHESGREGLCRFLDEHPDDPEIDVMRFFLGSRVPAQAGAAEMAAALRDQAASTSALPVTEAS